MEIKIEIIEYADEELNEGEERTLGMYLDSTVEISLKVLNSRVACEIISTFQDAILIEILDILVDLGKNENKEKVLEAYGNDIEYVFKKEKESLYIFERTEGSKREDWKKVFNFFEFKQSFVEHDSYLIMEKLMKKL